VAVVHCLRTVDADTYQEMVIMKKTAPLIVQECTVRLQTVVNLSSLAILPLQLQRFPIEVDTSEQRFAPMPRKKHVGNRLRLQVLANELLQQRLAHYRALVQSAP
jgi:hypothetical protein